MKTRKAIDLLEDACRKATLETAAFSNITRSSETPCVFKGRPINEGNVTEFIRERVRLHHLTWVIGPMEEVLTLLRAEASRRKKEPRDPTPWCTGCSAKRKVDCHCGPIASNE